MGMYTELVFKADIDKELPVQVRKVLEYMFNGNPQPETLPDHKFFQTSRWDALGSMSSFYHIPWATSRYENDYIFSRSDIKNYSDEIELFIDWVTPYLNLCLDEDEDKCVGWYWYEESSKPNLIMVKG